ncbi:MAG: NAD(P)H-dependent glycerol-3-phosphate dehydrogenase [Culicoidibacterales bacterium]
MKIAVIGAGAWGGALATVLDDNGHDVIIWSHRPEDADYINKNHKISVLEAKQIPHKLSKTITSTHILSRAVCEVDYILFVVPSFALREVALQVKSLIEKPIICISATKGIESETHLLMSEIIEEVLGKKCLGAVALTGPSHAEEVIQRKITAIVSANENIEYATAVQKLFNNGTYFRVYANTDRKGAELGGALKNIIAVISGMLAAYNLGDNARAALITRGLYEMTKIGVCCGAKERTFAGLAGLGDLIVTTTSSHSRNFQAGMLLAQGLRAAEIETKTKATIEGFHAVKAALEIVKQHNVYAPLIGMIDQLLKEEITPEIMLEMLFDREMKDEFNQI